MILSFNFTDIIHSILMIFRIICGECYEPMHECWKVSGPTCLFLFYPTVILGNFLVTSKIHSLLNFSFTFSLFVLDAKFIYGNAFRFFRCVIFDY